MRRPEPTPRALRENHGRVNPLGLYDLDRRIRPVGTAFKQIIEDWRHVLPKQRLFTQEPFEMPTDRLDGAS